jgi:hypothetical protein
VTTNNISDRRLQVRGHRRGHVLTSERTYASEQDARAYIKAQRKKPGWKSGAYRIGAA